MIFSRTTQYAIQTLLLLAEQPGDRYVMCQVLASELRLPRAYLSKIMVRLGVAGIVESSRGRAGGYRLRVRPQSVSLRRVAEAVHLGHLDRECLLGLKACSDDSACAVHCQWKPVKASVLALLEDQSLGRLAEEVRRGRYRLHEINVAALLPGSDCRPDPAKGRP